MALAIHYSLRAQQEEIELLEYIVENFGQAKGKEVYERIERILGEIAKMPEMYPASIKRKGLRKCVLSRQTSIFYRVNPDYIDVVSFRPNRKDPKGI